MIIDLFMLVEFCMICLFVGICLLGCMIMILFICKLEGVIVMVVLLLIFLVLLGSNVVREFNVDVVCVRECILI